MATTHIHIGAGRFGLGMVLDICRRAGFQSALLHRLSDKAHHPTLRRHSRYTIIYEDTPSAVETVSLPIHYYENETDPRALELLAEPSVVLITTSVTPNGLRGV